MDIKTIYEDNDVLVIDKPAGIVVFPEGQTKENTLIDALIEKYPELKNAGEGPRYGIVHRLDKDTSGVLLVAKSSESLIFLQKQFKNREVEKKYVCLVEGAINGATGEIKTLIARSPKDARKQKVYSENEPHPKSAREAITEYKVLEDYKDYTLLEVEIKTGRRHQIRCHFSYLQHPIAGDKLYGFRNAKNPEGLTRQFLHAQKLKIQLPDGQTQEFISDLPEDLKTVLNNLVK
jgi:23S rRNA pseudouridine1911/1915/1917 synthase